MKVWFKWNRSPACYDTEYGGIGVRFEPGALTGPFPQCAGCGYAAHGFLCYTTEGDCLRTNVQNSKRKVDRKHG